MKRDPLKTYISKLSEKKFDRFFINYISTKLNNEFVIFNNYFYIYRYGLNDKPKHIISVSVKYIGNDIWDLSYKYKQDINNDRDTIIEGNWLDWGNDEKRSLLYLMMQNIINTQKRDKKEIWKSFTRNVNKLTIK
jgi:hypothetical protein